MGPIRYIGCHEYYSAKKLEKARRLALTRSQSCRKYSGSRSAYKARIRVSDAIAPRKRWCRAKPFRRLADRTHVKAVAYFSNFLSYLDYKML